MQLELVFFASPLARKEETEASAAWVRREIEGLAVIGDAVGSRPAPGPPDRPGQAAGPEERTPVAVVLTGGTEDQVLDWLGGFSGPALLLALPHSNSLPACLEVLARLRQTRRFGRIVVAGRGDWRRELERAARTEELVRFMSQARLGLFGGPSSWLAASSPEPGLVRRVWGPEVIVVPLSEVVERYTAMAAEAKRTEETGEEADLLRRAAGIVEPDRAAVSGALRLYRVFRDLSAAYRLDALTVRCFDLLGELGNTGCLALSRLNDEGLAAACEGDLPATLTMMVLGRISGRPCFMANPSDVDLEKGTVTFAHCSVPLSLVKGFRLRSHFESGLGVGLEGHPAPGKMTVARIGGRDLDEVQAFTGTVLPAEDVPRREDLCRTQVTLKVGSSAVRNLLERPLGNHHVLTPGDHAEDFLSFSLLARRPAGKRS